MKQLISLSLVIFLLAACRKEKKDTGHSGITGKWKLTERYFSNGSPGSWEPVSILGGAVTIEFKENGEFVSSPNFPKASLQLNQYTFSGTSLSMSSTLNTNTDTWPVHILNIEKLDVSLYTCFEGCAYRFTRYD